MGQDPTEVREEIEDTRARMAETVDALGEKADIKARVGGYLSEKKDAVTGRVSGALPDTDAVKEPGRRALGMAQENPIGLAVGGTALGVLAGLLLPSTRAEDERMGSVADDVKQRVRETGREAVASGTQVARDAAESAVDTARERAGEKGDDLSTSLRQNAEELVNRGDAEQ